MTSPLVEILAGWMSSPSPRRNRTVPTPVPVLSARSVTSPPPHYNFHNIPVVQGRYPIWQMTIDAPVVRGLSTTKRETLVTSVMDAQPELRFDIPGPSIWPVLVALGATVALIPGIFTPWAFLVGAILTGAALTAWFFGDPNYENKTARETGERSETVSRTPELQPKEV